MDQLQQTTQTRTLTTYRPLPDSAEKRTYKVASALLRAADRLGVTERNGGPVAIRNIVVYHRTVAVVSLPIVDANDAIAVLDLACQNSDMRGIHMLVMLDTSAQHGVLYVANLYSRDMVDYWQRM